MFVFHHIPYMDTNELRKMNKESFREKERERERTTAIVVKINMFGKLNETMMK